MYKKNILIIIFCIILTSCGNIQQKSPAITKVSTPEMFSTNTSQVIFTKTALPSKTQAEAIKSTDTIVPTFTSTLVINQDCQELAIEDYSPKQGIQGIIPLLNSRNKSADSYLLDLGSAQKISAQNEQNDIIYVGNDAVSPDGKWFAYLSSVELGNQKLIILNSKGVIVKQIDLNTIIEAIYPIRIGGWVDTEHVILLWGGYVLEDVLSPSEAITVILNPFTGEWIQYSSDYQNIFTMTPDFYYNWGNFSISLSVYNQLFDRVLYLSNDGVVLWDLMNQKQIKLFIEKPQYSNIKPVWSPDGNNFVIDLDTENGRNLFLVSKDGEEKQITFMRGYQSENINNYSWSPDGDSIAFWLLNKFDEQEVFYYYNLNILNLSTQEIQSFCITAYTWRQYYSDWYPIWSPNGKYLVVAASDEIDLSSPITVLIDLANQRAYKLADDVIPAGWMVSE